MKIEAKMGVGIFIAISVVILASVFFTPSGTLSLAAFSNASVLVTGTQEPVTKGSGSGVGPKINNSNISPIILPVVEQQSALIATPDIPAQETPAVPLQSNIVSSVEVIQTPQNNLLPSSVASLAQAIPQFAKILAKLNVNDTADVINLNNHNIYLPGLKEIMGADFASLTREQKKKIPPEILFVLLGNGKISALTKLDFSNLDAVEQKVNVFKGSALHLVLRPKATVKGISGRIIFKAPANKVVFTGKYISSFNLALSALTAPGTTNKIASPTNAPIDALQADQQFSVLDFNYNDIDKDGVYEADINAPLVQGEYEILTSINYASVTEGNKDVKFTTLVDPEGYVYEKVGNKELRISNATASLYKLNTNNNQYEAWPAGEYGQENAQITDATGNYSFLVPAGTYYLTVTAPGYALLQIDPFNVSEGKQIHANIPLKKEFDLFSFLNWNIVLIIFLLLLVAYNFYRDWKREK